MHVQVRASIGSQTHPNAPMALATSSYPIAALGVTRFISTVVEVTCGVTSCTCRSGLLMASEASSHGIE